MHSDICYAQSLTHKQVLATQLHLLRQTNARAVTRLPHSVRIQQGRLQLDSSVNKCMRSICNTVSKLVVYEVCSNQNLPELSSHHAIQHQTQHQKTDQVHYQQHHLQVHVVNGQ
jgi:hypothetical protein